MKLKKKSMLTGKENTMNLPISEEEFNKCFNLFKEGEMINDAFPSLNEKERDFILTGMTEDEWNSVINESCT